MCARNKQNYKCPELTTQLLDSTTALAQVTIKFYATTTDNCLPYALCSQKTFQEKYVWLLRDSRACNLLLTVCAGYLREYKTFRHLRESDQCRRCAHKYRKALVCRALHVC